MNVALVRAASQASSMGGLGSTTALPTAGKSAAPDPVMKKREEQQRQRAEKVFREHDEDDSGTIDVHELSRLADYLGLPIDGDVDEVMQELDKDSSGKLEKEEFVRWWLDRVLPPENYRRQQEVIARNVFMRSGGGDDGKIDIQELEDLTASLGMPLSSEELSRAMERLDTNGDGTLQQEEFVTWWVEKSMNWDVDDELSKKLRRLAETARRRLSTDIHSAVWQGDVMLVDEFLKADPLLVNAEDTSEYGQRYRPLHYAAYQGHLPLCQLLVQQGAKVSAPTSTGVHAVLLAAQMDHGPVVKFLLDEGSDPSVCETEQGLCAVDVAEYSPAALQVFKDFSRLSKPDKPAEAPQLRPYKGSSLELHFPEHHRTAPFQLPVQELKVKILVQEQGEGGGEKMVSLAIFPAKTTPIILPDLLPQHGYRVQVAYLNGLGAGPYSEPSNVMMTGTGRGTATPTEGGDGARSQGEGDKENAGADENQRTRRHSRSGSVTSTGSRRSNGPSARSPSPSSAQSSSTSLHAPLQSTSSFSKPTASRAARRLSRGSGDTPTPTGAGKAPRPVDKPAMAIPPAADDVSPLDDAASKGPNNPLLTPLQPSRPMEGLPAEPNPRQSSLRGHKTAGLTPLGSSKKDTGMGKGGQGANKALDDLPDIDIDL